MKYALSIVTLLAAVLTGSAYGQESDRETATLSVSGQAELDVPADELSINIGVTSQGEEAEPTLDENSEAMNKVIDALEKAGLTEDEYETGRFDIRPQYAQRPRRAMREGEVYEPEIVSYVVTNSVTVTTKKLEHAGEIIEAAANAGANTINNIRFQLSDERIHRADAIRQATKNALQDAHTLADAASVRLVRILRLSLDQSGYQPMTWQRGRAMAAMDAEMAAPISPGDVTVNASVTIVYEIAPAD